jgi:hypothetical protein
MPKMTKISRLIHVRLKRPRVKLLPVLAIAVMILATFAAIPPAAAQTITATFTGTRGEDNTFTGLIDTLHGFAYFATDTQPGIIVKVRLSDFTRVGSLVLSGQGEQFSSAGVINPQGDYAIFGSFFSDVIEKVRLSDFTEVGSIHVSLRPHIGFVTAVDDPANGFAYFGDFFGKIIKIRTSDLTIVGSLTLPAGTGLFGSIIDTANGFAYFNAGGFNNDGTIYKIRLSNFTIANSLLVGPQISATPLFDPTTGLSYWPTETDPGTILRIRTSDMSLTGNLTLNADELSPNSGIIDPSEGFAYFGTQAVNATSSSKIIKINLANFKRVSTLVLNPTEPLLFLSAGGVIQTETSGGSFGYFATYSSPSFVIKVKLSSMSRAATLTLQQGREYFDSSIIDTNAGFVYFGTDAPPFGTSSATGAITRIRTSDFTDAGTLVLQPGEGQICSAVIDTAHGFAYFATRSMPATVIKVRLSDFSRVGAMTFNIGEDGACTGVLDPVNGFAYFGTSTFPGIVVKIRLSDFTRVGALTLASGEDSPLSSVIDVNAGFAYFGTFDFPGIISKVRLSDLTEVGSLTLNPGEDSPPAAVIDPARGFAYFGTADAPALVVKVRLSDFTENSTLTTSCTSSIACFFGPQTIASAVIDTAHDAAYFGAVGVILKVQLSTFTETGFTFTPNPIDFLGSASIDPSAGTAYFGVDSTPGIVYKVTL